MTVTNYETLLLKSDCHGSCLDVNPVCKILSMTTITEYPYGPMTCGPMALENNGGLRSLWQ